MEKYVTRKQRRERRLKKIKVPHEVLNAKNHAREAEIIAKVSGGTIKT